MKGAALLVLAILAAGAMAETPREACVRIYADSFNAATSRDDRCKASHVLSQCFSTTVTDSNERILAQGFLDATQFNEDCSDYVIVKDEKVSIETADKNLKLGLGRGKDMVVTRTQEPEVISIWSVNRKVSDLTNTAAMKADFVSLQSTIAALQRTQGGVIDTVKTDLLSWVDTRLAAVESNIRSSLTASLGQLQTATNNLKTSFSDRVAALDSTVSATTSSIARSIINQIDGNNTVLLSSITKVMADTNQTSLRITALDSTINTRINTSISAAKSTTDRLNAALAKTPILDASMPVFRYATWSTYSQNHGWFCNDNPAMYGGVNPSTWTDGNGYAHSMSADKNVLRTLFNKKQWGGTNALLQANEWYYYSSTNGQVTGALFRIRNTLTTAVTWRTFFYFSSYSGWSEAASVALNGVNQWTYSGSCGSCSQNIDLAMPPSRVSTVIFISTSGSPNGSRTNFLAFYNNCLLLPSGLEYVDDLDYATGGWEA